MLILMPDESARTLPGFQTGDPLSLKASRPNETVGELLDKLNVYRGPNQQINTVWTPEGAPMDRNTKVTGNIIAIVKAT